MKTYELVCLGKVKQGMKSDREFALFNGLSVQNISDWKAERANPNTGNFLILIEAAGLGLKEAKEIASAIEKRKNLKQTGFANVVFLSALSFGSFGAMSLLKMTGTPYESIANRATELLSVYIMLNDKLIKITKIKGQLRTLNSLEMLQLIASNDMEAGQVTASGFN